PADEAWLWWVASLHDEIGSEQRVRCPAQRVAALRRSRLDENVDVDTPAARHVAERYLSGHAPCGRNIGQVPGTEERAVGVIGLELHFLEHLREAAAGSADNADAYVRAGRA